MGENRVRIPRRRQDTTPQAGVSSTANSATVNSLCFLQTSGNLVRSSAGRERDDRARVLSNFLTGLDANRDRRARFREGVNMSTLDVDLPSLPDELSDEEITLLAPDRRVGFTVSSSSLSEEAD